jgi:hypothetical protein
MIDRIFKFISQVRSNQVAKAEKDGVNTVHRAIQSCQANVKLGHGRMDWVVMYVPNPVMLSSLSECSIGHTRGPFHCSRSDKIFHWTICGFRKGFSRFTIHAYPDSQACWWANGGRWDGKKQLDIQTQCQPLDQRVEERTRVNKRKD